MRLFLQRSVAVRDVVSFFHFPRRSAAFSLSATQCRFFVFRDVVSLVRFTMSDPGVVSGRM